MLSMLQTPPRESAGAQIVAGPGSRGWARYPAGSTLPGLLECPVAHHDGAGAQAARERRDGEGEEREDEGSTGEKEEKGDGREIVTSRDQGTNPEVAREALGLQEEKHQFFLKLKKVVDEEEKFVDEEVKRAEWSDHSDFSCRQTRTHFLSLQGHPRALSHPAGRHLHVPDGGKQMSPPQVLTTWHSVGPRLSQGTQSTRNAKAAQAVPMGLLSSHLTLDPLNFLIVLVSSSERLQHFLQCSPCLSHNHSPKPCTATFIPPRQGVSSLVVGALALQKQMERTN